MKKHLITVAAGTLLFITCKNENKDPSGAARENIRTVTVTADTSFSRFIPKDSANKMISSYLASINAPYNDTALRSVIIDVNQLRRYIDSMPGSNQITNVKLMFGHTLSYINAGHSGQYAGYTSGKLTLIISAYNANGTYVYFNNNEVVDFGMPCPSNCPSGDAAGPLLQ